MTEYLEIITDFLNTAQNEVSVFVGFPSDPSPTPLLTKQAYVTSDRIDGDELQFRITVYQPAFQGGKDCLAAAETLADILKNEFTGRVTDILIGGISYSDDCMAFTSAVTGTLSTAQTHSFSAYNFSRSSELSFEREIPSYKIVRSFNDRPVMTVLSSVPLTYHDDENMYRITLSGVPKDIVESISENGMFTLSVDEEEFFLCRCVGSTDTQDALSELEIEGYKPRERALDDLPPDYSEAN